MIKLDKNEKIIFKIRKHWFILFAESFFLIFLLLFPVAGFIAINATDMLSSIQFAGNVSYLLIAISATWFLFLWIAFFVIWTDYYLDILILTNLRVVNIDQRGLFSRKVSTFKLHRIQDVSVDVHGIIPTLLGFGKVHIQTAGESQKFVISGIPHPYKTKSEILKGVNARIKTGIIV